MVRSAEVFYLVRKASELGVETGSVAINWQRALDRKNRVVEDLSVDEGMTLRERGVSVVASAARFVSPHRIVARKREIEAGRFVIATGSRPSIPRVPGLELAITSDDVFTMRSLPRSALIVGGGVIAMEIAHMWNAFGVKVTVLEIGSRILSTMDEEMAGEISRISAERGIEIIIGARAENVQRCIIGLSASVRCPDQLRELDAETILVAAGRVPVVDGLGLPEAGIAVKNGRIAVDLTLQTSVKHVYAAGDVTGGQSLATMAAYEGRIAARNALRDDQERVDLSAVPTSVFTIPTLSSIGLTEGQAKNLVSPPMVTRLPFSRVPGAIVADGTEGMIKIISDSTTGEILGAHILGSHSEELIHIFALAMHSKISLDQLGQVIPVDPSFSEGVIGAALTARTGHPESYCG